MNKLLQGQVHASYMIVGKIKSL